MSELRRHGRELLDASRLRRTPLSEQKRKIVEGLVATAAQTAHDVSTRPPLAQRLSGRAKVLVLLTLLAAVALATYWLGRH